VKQREPVPLRREDGGEFMGLFASLMIPQGGASKQSDQSRLSPGFYFIQSLHSGKPGLVLNKIKIPSLLRRD